MDPKNIESVEIENEEHEQEHGIEEEEPEGSQGQVIEEEDEVIEGTYQENGNGGHEILALEAEFRMTHDSDLARKLIEIYRDADDVANLRRVRETFLEHNLLLEGM